MASNPTGSKVDVALAGDAWVSAINARIAVRDPYLAGNPAFEVDLWDGNALDACCTTPIGYHPSVYGAYLSALVLFFENYAGEAGIASRGVRPRRSPPL